MHLLPVLEPGDDVVLGLECPSLGDGRPTTLGGWT